MFFYVDNYLGYYYVIIKFLILFFYLCFIKQLSKIKPWRSGTLYLSGQFYATSSQNRRKNRSTTWEIASSRGKPPLHHINEQFLDEYTNDKTSLVYIGV